MSVPLDPSVPKAGLCPLPLHRAEPGSLRPSTGRAAAPQTTQGRAGPLSEWSFAGRRASGEAGKGGGALGKGRAGRGGAGQGAWQLGEVN